MSANELRQAAETLRERAEGVRRPYAQQERVDIALAKWLDDIAAGWMWDGEEPGVVDFDGDRLTFEGSMDTHPLAIARLINGGAA